MPKGKKCSQLNCNGRMRRNYTRSYSKGLRFTEEHVLGIEVKTGKYNPIGWLCDECGIFISDNELGSWSMFRNIEKRKMKQRKKRRRLWYKLKQVRIELMEYKEISKQDVDFAEKYLRAVLTRRCWEIKSSVAVREFLKGLKEGGKNSDKYWEEKFERERLTDDQILKKAKDIESGRKYRGES